MITRTRLSLFGLILLGFLILFFTRGYLPPLEFPTNQLVKIEPGSSLSEIAVQLEQRKVISSSRLFKILVERSNKTSGVIAGWYQFEKPLPSPEIARRLTDGWFTLNPVKLTVPEGLNARELTQIVSEKFPELDVNTFHKLALANQGYLFPDTYSWPSQVTASEMIILLRENFERQAKTLETQITESGRSLGDIVAMASLVEEEVSDPRERRVIAGVLWKRLDAAQKLEVDVDPATYENLGLPPAPIANPSLDALKAVLAPTPTDYWFYLSDKNGTIHYAKNFAEHQRNIAKYLK